MAWTGPLFVENSSALHPMVAIRCEWCKKTMDTEVRSEGPLCSRCGGRSVRAAQTQALSGQKEKVYYLAYLWSCAICGNKWVDDGLERLNAGAAEGARILAKRAS